MNSFMSWVGGKKALREEIVSRLNQKCDRYVEVFGGGGWVLFHKPPGKFEVYQVNDTLWEGSFYPRLPNGKRKKFNVYAKTKKECEKKLAKMITEKKKEIAKQKAAMKKSEG